MFSSSAQMFWKWASVHCAVVGHVVFGFKEQCPVKFAVFSSVKKLVAVSRRCARGGQCGAE